MTSEGALTMQRNARNVSKLGTANVRRHTLSVFFRHLLPANQPASSVQGTADPLAATPIPRTLLLWLTFGVAGTVLFPIIYVIEGATRPGYDAWRQTISSLSLGPGGWIQQLNFALCGVSG
jgi:uncharacterized protein DUF998